MYLNNDQLPSFLVWLDDQGAQVLPTTNPYEVVRFKTANGVSVLYKNKHGAQTFTGECEIAYKHFREKKRWITHDRHRKQMTSLKTKLANRDGLGCFWCGEPHETVNTLTVEHILNKMHGGSDNSRNLSLACDPCNVELSNLPIVKKILYREKKLAARTGIVIIDEATDTPPEVFEQIQPVLAGVQRHSTPKEPNMFHKIFNRRKKS